MAHALTTGDYIQRRLRPMATRLRLRPTGLAPRLPETPRTVKRRRRPAAICAAPCLERSVSIEAPENHATSFAPRKCFVRIPPPAGQDRSDVQWREPAKA